MRSEDDRRRAELPDCRVRDARRDGTAVLLLPQRWRIFGRLLLANDPDPDLSPPLLPHYHAHWRRRERAPAVAQRKLPPPPLPLLTPDPAPHGGCCCCCFSAHAHYDGSCFPPARLLRAWGGHSSPHGSNSPRGGDGKIASCHALPFAFAAFGFVPWRLKKCVYKNAPDCALAGRSRGLPGRSPLASAQVNDRCRRAGGSRTGGSRRPGCCRGGGCSFRAP